ncbi:hypothetical protein Tsubulata_015090 [Turnera subulata]|uniref:Uncharacterized protein n=1 Tax=Turnera subulata TaxID=218843 RepID=A0A9Q0JLF4_9ROSI|nr:hypothetical protein Tsubulata_015090 [Turnera subulata]
MFPKVQNVTDGTDRPKRKRRIERNHFRIKIAINLNLLLLTNKIQKSLILVLINNISGPPSLKKNTKVLNQNFLPQNPAILFTTKIITPRRFPSLAQTHYTLLLFSLSKPFEKNFGSSPVPYSLPPLFFQFPSILLFLLHFLRFFVSVNRTLLGFVFKFHSFLLFCDFLGMSNNWRRQRGELHHHDVQGTRSRGKKPSCGSWQPTVPSWEKKFCYSVGSIPWRKLLETKRFMYLYENVVQWNDSAGEEAFHNAKNRYWAEMNGLPCNISLPDPDVYIDKIDWNCNVDPELLLDLEREPKEPDGGNKGEEDVILGKSLLFNQSFSCTGWGGAEEEFQKVPNPALDSAYVDQNNVGGNYMTPYIAQNNGAVENNGWGDWCNDLCGWGNNYDGWNNNFNEWKDGKDGTGGEGGTWDRFDMREGVGQHMSRYKTTRFHGRDYQMGRGWWKNGRGRRRVNFVY